MPKAQLVIASVIAGVACSGAHAGLPEQKVVSLEIESQPLERAIYAWSSQTGYQVLMPADLGAPGSTAPVIKGGYTPAAALQALLAGSNIRYEFINATTVAITAPAGEGGGGSAPVTRASGDIEQVLVTAQKRTERLLDVPVPVTAITSTDLIDSNQLRLQDYYSRIPGLSMTVTDYGPPVLSIRGMATGNFINPTTGVVVDEIPFANHSAAFPSQVPDLDPGDLERVEVLRGPQGTLYGASSMGGLVKFVTADPSTDALTGRLQAGMSSVRNGNDLGYNIRGSANVPISDTWAIRASGFKRSDPGYIDNVLTGQNGVNSGDVWGGRVSALWKPSDTLSLKLSALHQDIKTDGSAGVVEQPGLGEFDQSNVRGSGASEKRLSVFGATLTAGLGRAELTSVTGYATNAGNQSYDFSRNAFFRGLAQSTFGVSGITFGNDSKGSNFTQELRLSTALGSKVDWLVGGFYNHEEAEKSVSSYKAFDPVTGALAGVGMDLATQPHNKFVEYAAFTNFTFHATETFDVQVGGRQSHSSQSFGNYITGPLVPRFFPGKVSPYVRPKVDSDNTAFTYLVTPEWRITPDVMVYARLASGFRPGGPNISNADNANIPREFEPDKTQNYEIGMKGSVLDRMLTFDASVYYIDWKDIQLTFLGTAQQGFLGYIGNGGPAKSQGVELSLEARPITGLVIGTWLSWNEAELDQNLAPNSAIFGREGDRLPFSSRFSGNLSVDQDFNLTSNLHAFYGATLSYVGSRMGSFGSSLAPQRQTFPAYAKTDLRLGLKHDSWTENLVVTNLTDRRGVVYGGLQTFDASVFDFIQPRTFGVSVTKTF